MVFDVESVGLHGEGFQAGAVLIDRSGKTLGEHFFACDLSTAAGPDEGREWVAANVPPPDWSDDGVRRYNCRDPRHLREKFWQVWLLSKDRGAVLVADCAWPVEARFLAECVDDDPANRYWDGPYPLHDLASIRLAAGLDPLATEERRPNELPIHDPLADARQSARLLIEALGRLRTSD